MGSLRAEKSLVKLGRDLRAARLSRRMTIADLAERAGSSESTIARLEKGDRGVALGVLSEVMAALGSLDRLGGVMDRTSDEVGQTLMEKMRPKRGRGLKSSNSSVRGAKSAATSRDTIDPDGVGF